MLKRLALALLIALTVAATARSQSTTVSATVTDAGGVAWANGTFSFTLVAPQGATWAGGNITSPVTGSLNSSGALSQSLPDVNTIAPGPAAWTLQVCPRVGIQQSCFTQVSLKITGTSQALTVTPPAISIPGSLGLTIAAYADAEIAAPVPLGFIYYQPTSATAGNYRQCQVVTSGACTTWGNVGSGGGGSTSFSAITSGTNTSAAMVCSTGCSFTLSNGSGASFSFNPVNGNLTWLGSPASVLALYGGPTQKSGFDISPGVGPPPAVDVFALDTGWDVNVEADKDVILFSATSGSVRLTDTHGNNVIQVTTGGLLGFFGGTPAANIVSAPNLAATGAGAASASPFSLTGTLFTGGSGTTTFPYAYINPGSNTGPTTWSTSGTLLGMDAPSGFAGNFLDMHVNGGASVASLSSAGALTAAALTCGVLNTTACVITGYGSTSGTATLTWPAVAGTSTNPVTFSNVLEGPNGSVSAPTYGFTNSTGSGLWFDGAYPEITQNGSRVTAFPSTGPQSGAGTIYGWTSTAGNPGLSADTGISRTAAATIAVGNGTPSDASGTINAAGYQAGGTAGVTAGNFTAVTSITTKAGLVTVLSGTSDARLKNAKPYQGGLAEVLAITPALYTWNAKGQKQTGLPGNKEYVGFLAQDVQKAIPQAITATERSKDGSEEYLSFDDRPIVAALVNAVKEQQKEIQQLRKEIASIRGTPR